jgi:hypothetical protein
MGTPAIRHETSAPNASIDGEIEVLLDRVRSAPRLHEAVGPGRRAPQALDGIRGLRTRLSEATKR